MKTIRLKESDIQRMVKRVVNEQGEGPQGILEPDPEVYKKIGEDMLEGLGRQNDVIIKRGSKTGTLELSFKSMEYGDITIRIPFEDLQEIVGW